MRKGKLFTLLSLGILGLGSLSLGIIKGLARYSVARAEGDEQQVVEPEPEQEVYECSVIIAECKNGSIEVDKLEGHIGDIVTINAKHDVLYLIECVKANGTDLVEDEEISGKYTFALVEGENKIEAKFVIDQELLGEMAIIMDQAKNKDWTNLFSIENIIRVISLLLSSSVLVAIVRYFVKDKKLEAKLEKGVTDTVSKVIPEATKEIVLKTIQDFITPVFSELKLDNQEMRNALTSFSRCIALSQENTPEARAAIIQELSSLNLSDQASIQLVKQQLDDFIAKQNENFLNILAKMQKMEDTNKGIIEASETTTEEVAEDKPEATPYE